jgi:hypothetical protein
MKVKRKRRVLLVVANLTTWGRKDLERLYEWLDANAVNVAKLILGARYRRVYALTGADAAADKFVSTLTELATNPHNQAIDVLLHLHGERGRLWFADDVIQTSELAGLIAEQQIQDKLRLLYSTACYGATHAPDFVEAGFRVASGAVGVNANSPHDYPTQLLYWGLGSPYRNALAAGNSEPLTKVFDKMARKLKFTDVNSFKKAVGRKKTSITSGAV